MITLKEFATPLECFAFAKTMAASNDMCIEYHLFRDNLTGQTYTPGEDNCYALRHFGLTPESKKKLSSSQFPNQIRFYLKEKGESVTYLIKFKPAEKKEKTMVLNNRGLLFSYIKKLCIKGEVGIIACNMKSVDGSDVIPIDDLSIVPKEAYQIHSNDLDRATSKLELNFYMPLSNRYLNLKLKRVQESA